MYNTSNRAADATHKCTILVKLSISEPCNGCQAYCRGCQAYCNGRAGTHIISVAYELPAVVHELLKIYTVVYCKYNSRHGYN